MINITAEQARALAEPMDIDKVGEEVSENIREAASQGKKDISYSNAAFKTVGKKEGYGIDMDIVRLTNQLERKGFEVQFRLDREDLSNVYVKAIEVRW